MGTDCNGHSDKAKAKGVKVWTQEGAPHVTPRLGRTNRTTIKTSSSYVGREDWTKKVGLAWGWGGGIFRNPRRTLIPGRERAFKGAGRYHQYVTTGATGSSKVICELIRLKHRK